MTATPSFTAVFGSRHGQHQSLFHDSVSVRRQHQELLDLARDGDLEPALAQLKRYREEMKEIGLGGPTATMAAPIGSFMQGLHDCVRERAPQRAHAGVTKLLHYMNMVNLTAAEKAQLDATVPQWDWATIYAALDKKWNNRRIYEDAGMVWTETVADILSARMSQMDDLYSRMVRWGDGLWDTMMLVDAVDRATRDPVEREHIFDCLHEHPQLRDCVLEALHGQNSKNRPGYGLDPDCFFDCSVFVKRLSWNLGQAIRAEQRALRDARVNAAAAGSTVTDPPVLANA